MDIVAPPADRILPEKSSPTVAGLGQSKGGHMARELSNETSVCLYYGAVNFVLCAVSPETPEEVVRKLYYRSDSPPDDEIYPFGNADYEYCGTSFVSVGSMVYCIGGWKGNNAINEVTKFDTNKSSFELHQIRPHMIQGRYSPAVIAIGKKIYVFGGLIKETNSNDSPWGECLDTKKPIHKQRWKPLTQPPSLLSLGYWPFAILYDANTILIGSRHGSKVGSLLYDVHTKVWKEYKFSHRFENVRRPVSVISEKTMYWFYDWLIVAYDLDTHVTYAGSTEKSLLPDVAYSGGLLRMGDGPVLMHLKDNLFCCFTVYVEDIDCPSETGVLECTKFRVTKDFKSSKRVLQLHHMGYKSYKCKTMFTLYGIVPIQAKKSSKEITESQTTVLK